MVAVVAVAEAVREDFELAMMLKFRALNHRVLSALPILILSQQHWMRYLSGISDCLLGLRISQNRIIEFASMGRIIDSSSRNFDS